MAGAVFSFNIDLRANTAGMTRGFGRARQELGLFSGNVGSLSGGLAKFGVAGAAAGAAVVALTNVFSAGKQAAQAFIDTVVVGGIQSAASFEQQQVSFEVMLGSLDDANNLLAQLNAFAADTPFQFDELTESSKKLVAFNVAQEDIIPTMRRLGDIAAGLGIPLTELAELYGKAKIQGRLFAEDINQLTGRGIPIIGELAAQFGVAESGVRKLVESGEVNFGHLEQAFKDLTSEGGKFAGLMAKQSQTVNGLWSTLGDNISLTITKIGQDLIGAFDLKDAIKTLIAGTAELKSVVESGFGPMIQEINALGEALLGGQVTIRTFTDAIAGGFVIIADAAYSAKQAVLAMKAVLGDSQAALDFAANMQQVPPGAKILMDLIAARQAIKSEVDEVNKTLSGIGGNDIFGNILDFATGLGLNEVLRPKSMAEQPKFSDLSPAALAARTTEAFSAALKNTKTAQADPVVKGIRDLIKAQGEEVAATNRVNSSLQRFGIKEAIV